MVITLLSPPLFQLLLEGDLSDCRLARNRFWDAQALKMPVLGDDLYARIRAAAHRMHLHIAFAAPGLRPLRYGNTQAPSPRSP